MRYEFYDQAGNLIGLRANPEGTAIKRDEKITLQYEGRMNWLKVIGVSAPVGGLQKVTVRPI